MHSNLFLSVNATQIYCPLDHDLRAVHSSSPTETFSVSLQTETPFLSLTHTAHHSYLIRGGDGGGGRGVHVIDAAAGQLLPNRKTFWV